MQASGLRMFLGAGIAYDYGSASFDIRNVVHLSRSLRASLSWHQALHVVRRCNYERPARRLDRELGRRLEGGQPITLSYWALGMYGML